jgi:RNA polymerase sigma-70 factor (family 1)
MPKCLSLIGESSYKMLLMVRCGFLFETRKFSESQSYRLQHQNNYTTEDYFISFKEGEEQGFNYFFQQLYKPLLHFALSFLKQTESAEDVVEDAFVKLWQKKESIESASAIKPHLYKTVRNACIDIMRKQVHRDAYVVYVNKSSKEFAPDITQNIITTEAMRQVYLAVQNLPSKYKKVFNMLFVQGREIKEIAAELNLPLSTVKTHKSKALELLRKQLPHLGCIILFAF